MAHSEDKRNAKRRVSRPDDEQIKPKARSTRRWKRRQDLDHDRPANSEVFEIGGILVTQEEVVHALTAMLRDYLAQKRSR